MSRLHTLLALTALLPACAQFPDWVELPAFSTASTQGHTGHYYFDWQLSGDQRVAPMQVFDNAAQTWLQFHPDQSVPAIFSHGSNGDRPLGYTRQGDYLVLQGVPPALRFRGGALSAKAVRSSADNDASVVGDVSSSGAVPAAVLTLPESSSLGSAQLDEAVTSSAEVIKAITPATDLVIRPVHSGVSPALHKVPGPVIDGDVRVLTQGSFTPDVVAAAHHSYRVSPADQNLRQAIQRWAQHANWTFAPEHWAVEVDIPVSAEAVFSDGFKGAVQDLLASTELAERPLQPCFYSNRVLRVVPYAQACDRASGPQTS